MIAQEHDTGRILMFAWMNREALQLTNDTKQAVYWSRSRNKLWRKGEESGHVQRVHEIRLDCDEDVILINVEQVGGIACHTGRHNCFFKKLENENWLIDQPVIKNPEEIILNMNDTLNRLAELLEQRKSADPQSSYVAKLYAKGMDSILKKVGEEAAETIIAAKNGDKEHLIYETADLWFHTLVMLAQAGLKPQDILDELARREGLVWLGRKSIKNRRRRKIMSADCIFCKIVNGSYSFKKNL